MLSLWAKYTLIFLEDGLIHIYFFSVMRASSSRPMIAYSFSQHREREREISHPPLKEHIPYDKSRALRKRDRIFAIKRANLWWKERKVKAYKGLKTGSSWLKHFTPVACKFTSTKSSGACSLYTSLMVGMSFVQNHLSGTSIGSLSPLRKHRDWDSHLLNVKLCHQFLDVLSWGLRLALIVFIWMHVFEVKELAHLQKS